MKLNVQKTDEGTTVVQSPTHIYTARIMMLDDIQWVEVSYVNLHTNRANNIEFKTLQETYDWIVNTHAPAKLAPWLSKDEVITFEKVVE